MFKMKKRRREVENRIQRSAQRTDNVIAPDGFIPNSVVRAKIKGFSSNPQTMPNRLSQVSANQLSLKTTSAEEKPAQPTLGTSRSSSASTFYWESDPEDERIGPRTIEIIEEVLPGSANTNVVQVIEDYGVSQFNPPGVIQTFRDEETETHEGVESEPDGIQTVEVESRSSEELGVEEDLNLEKELRNSVEHRDERELGRENKVNGAHFGFSYLNCPEDLPSTKSCVNEFDICISSSEETTEDVVANDGHLHTDTGLNDRQVAINRRSGNDDDARSAAPRCVTPENDNEDEVNDADKLYSAAVVPDEPRKYEDNLTQVSVPYISEGKPAERPSVSAEEPSNLDDRRARSTVYEATKKRQPRLMGKTIVSVDKDSPTAAGHTISYQVIEVPSLSKWKQGGLLPNNPAMYRMYKKRDAMLSSV